MKYDAIYIRVSDETELDIQKNQMDTAIAYERQRGKTYVLFMDVASGKDTNRPAYNQMMEKVRKHEVEVVIFTSLSRMTRGGVQAALYILNELEGYQTGWHFIDQPMLNFDATTPKMVKDILLAVLAAVDEEYRANISRKTKAAYQRKKAAAEAVGSKTNWGRRRSPPKSASGEIDETEKSLF